MSLNKVTKLSRLASIINSLSKAGFTISVILVMASTLFILGTTLSRYLFNAPFEYQLEISGYMMLAMVFLAFAYTVMVGRHIGITFVVNRLPTRVRKVTALVMTVLSLGWIVPLLIGCSYTWLYFLTENVMPTVGLDMPFWIPAIPMVIGTVILLLQVLVEIGRKVTALKEDETNINAH